MGIQGRAASLAAVAFLALGVTGAAAATWQVHRFDADRFSVEFSGPVTVMQTPLKDEVRAKVVHSTIYEQDGGSFAFLVGATEYNIDYNFDGAINGTIAPYKCVSETATPLSAPNASLAREVRATNCAAIDGATTVVDFYRVGNWLYQVLYSIPAGADPSDAEHFRQSFVIYAN